jgi:DNA-binding transcriptional MerR regulator
MLMERGRKPTVTETDRAIITTGDAAKILQLSVDRVRQLERSGILTARRTATGIRLFDRDTVLRLARERK